jgi:hypothetical protein
MACDCDHCSNQSWWDWLEKEPGLFCTIWSLAVILTVSVALYLMITGDGG